MNKDYPDQKQRIAVCYSQWTRTKGNKTSEEPQVKGNAAFFSKNAIFDNVRNVDDKLKLWRKQVLSYGTWIHPQDKNVKFVITKDVIRQIVANFNTGFPIESPVILTHTDDPRRKIGIVKSYVQTDKGMDVIMAISDEEMNLNLGDEIKAPGVSVWLDLNYQDKQSGDSIGAVVKHVALVNHPYIEGLDKFKEVVSLSEDEKDEQKFIPLILGEKIKDGDSTLDKNEAIKFLKESADIDVEKLITDSTELTTLNTKIKNGELVPKVDAPTLSEDLHKKVIQTLSLSEEDAKNIGTVIEKFLAKIVELTQNSDRVTSMEQKLTEMEADKAFDMLLHENCAVPAEKEVLKKLFKKDATLFSEMVAIRKKNPMKLTEDGHSGETLDDIKTKNEQTEKEVERMAKDMKKKNMTLIRES